jgi:hypothetical protein
VVSFYLITRSIFATRFALNKRFNYLFFKKLSVLSSDRYLRNGLVQLFF